MSQKLIVGILLACFVLVVVELGCGGSRPGSDAAISADGTVEARSGGSGGGGGGGVTSTGGRSTAGTGGGASGGAGAVGGAAGAAGAVATGGTVAATGGSQAATGGRAGGTRGTGAIGGSQGATGGAATATGGAAGGAGGGGGQAGITYLGCTFTGGINRIVVAKNDANRSLCISMVFANGTNNAASLTLPVGYRLEAAFALPAASGCGARTPTLGAVLATGATGTATWTTVAAARATVDATLAFPPTATGVAATERLVTAGLDITPPCR